MICKAFFVALLAFAAVIAGTSAASVSVYETKERLRGAAKANHDRGLITLDGDVRGCIELKHGSTACGAKLIFGNCNRKINGFEERDLSGYDLVQLYSRKNTTMCMHAEPLVEGTYVRLRKCNSTSKFQKFEWYGQIKPTSDKTLCVAYPGQHASIGDYIKLKKCSKFNAGWSRD
jgi:hypothetical protein